MFYQSQTYNSSTFFTEPCAGQPESGKKVVQMFISVDPLADKYPGISGYAYCANNPLKYVDPDGRQIDITESTGDNGEKFINIKLTASLINKSSDKISSAKMESYRKRISNSISNYYGGDKGDGTTVKVDVDLTVANSIAEIPSSNHIFSIVDKTDSEKERSVGYTPIFGREAQISKNTLNHRPEKVLSHPMYGTGLDAFGRATLERTAAHEFGHQAGLSDIKFPDYNLMIQGENQNCGTNITSSQIIKMYGLRHKMYDGYMK